MLEMINEYGGIFAVSVMVLGIFVEITPIKINPVSWLFKWVRNALLGELTEKIEKMDKKIDDNEIYRLRWEILDFANSCRNKRKHSKEEFDHIIDANAKYHKILDSREQKNGQIDADYKYIMELYNRCSKENSFL